LNISISLSQPCFSSSAFCSGVSLRSNSLTSQSSGIFFPGRQLHFQGFVVAAESPIEAVEEGFILDQGGSSQKIKIF